jgi:RNA polymerase sigma-70 factor (sigma-E family)
VSALIEGPALGTVRGVSVGGDHAAPDVRREHAPDPGGGMAIQASACNHAEFRDYVATRSSTLLRMAYLLTGHRADAEDLVQVALAKTYLAWNRIQDRRAVDGYVRRAMVNTHISWWRQRRLEEYPTEHMPEQAAPDHAGDTDSRDALWRALARLPPRMRAAVALRFYEDMTETEIADVLGVSVGTVKSTISRAVAKLRIDAELLGDFGGYAARAAEDDAAGGRDLRDRGEPGPDPRSQAVSRADADIPVLAE